MASAKKDHVTAATELFGSGCNCAQAVFVSMAPELGLDKEAALRLSTGFGGGMGRLQKTCGAVTGAIMLLGLRYGMRNGSDQEAKKLCYEKVRELVSSFESACGGTECRALLGADLTAPEGAARAHEVCGRFVETGARIAERMLFGER